ncbi:putative addiction module killer protein [Moraxella lacunata]|uniref:Putative addiction module killer protein n=1 Tax=Moraxella lacunata TaxID=477 RepID=A0A378QEI2_MORLA|nr:type II toxin-antitoxin system RelE/ParE family toxin [Moraxella lacunata]STY98922.1 putative addiction module killer protein [Moraxella lacunata]
MFTIEKTEQFDEWLKSLKNPIAKKAVISRLLRLEMRHFGDIDNVGEGVFELRIHVNVGIRVYAIQKGETFILVLSGRDKPTQQADIIKAKEIAKTWENSNENH